jgi:hypothetical protein
MDRGKIRFSWMVHCNWSQAFLRTFQLSWLFVALVKWSCTRVVEEVKHVVYKKDARVRPCSVGQWSEHWQSMFPPLPFGRTRRQLLEHWFIGTLNMQWPIDLLWVNGGIYLRRYFDYSIAKHLTLSTIHGHVNLFNLWHHLHPRWISI